MMKEWEREELLIRMDERIKTIYNRMDKFETLFTNHLHHHEMWEEDIKRQVRWLVGVALSAATGVGAWGMM
jgi:alkylhydroperoxidase/carboxymuconolactone decarboxylase family protein YurZ|tara:strand:+ start:88 stop:300 length:213 start_codon:yes stop_codon:yes gene_type:complete